MKIRQCMLTVGLCLLMGRTGFAEGAAVSGELKVWHKITLGFDGPAASETAVPNPFTDYRLNVTFNGPSSQVYTVPGYYAADGNAANTSADAGNQWRAHLAPDEAGTWDYSVSFRTDPNVAVSDDPNAGISAGFMDGDFGSFVITPTDKTGRDFRSKGMLRYVGMHHLQFAGTGEYFLKCGVDSPENFLAYAEFDGPFKTDGYMDNLIKTWSPHSADWQPGDPNWAGLDGVAGTYGKGMIGALNYLAAEGLNSFSFLTMNIAGDDRNVFPYTDYNERLRMDVSRLAQWEVVFEHADTLGLFLHFKTQETENDQLLDGGELGIQRKLYYRELIARFGHHLALNWNLGEENTNTTAQINQFSTYFDTHDPYHHPVVLHTFPNEKDAVYTPLLGAEPGLDGASLQAQLYDFSDVHEDVRTWVQQSAAAGKPWVVSCDEPGNSNDGLVPDSETAEHDPGRINARRNALWGAVMAGGAGLEWFFGSLHDNNDRTCEDYRSRDLWWAQCRVMTNFFEAYAIPFRDMVSDDPLTSDTDDHCLKKDGAFYLVFLPMAGTTDITLPAGDFLVRWYNTRTAGSLQFGTVVELTGPGTFSIGVPPTGLGTDWLAMITAGQFLPPDFDADQDVDLADLVYFLGDWLRCNNPQDAACEQVLPAPQPMPAGMLVHHWPLDENTASTSTIADVAGGIDGTITGGVSSQAGKIGGALRFDGSNPAHVTLPDFSTGGLKTMTLAFWLHPDAGHVTDGTRKRVIAGADMWETTINPNSGTPSNQFYQAGGGANVLEGAAACDEEQWTHVAMTSVLGSHVNPGPVKIYINGVFDAQADTADDNWSGGELRFAHRPGADNAQHFYGMLDDIRMYNGVLSDAQILDIYNAADSANAAPYVNAGGDQTGYAGTSGVDFQMAATVSDDGRPEMLWTVESQPALSMVTFDPNDGVEDPLITVDTPGTYVLRLTVDDGALARFDEITLTATEADCQAVRDLGLRFETDLSGPGNTPDCYVNLHDFAALAAYWLTE